MIKNIQPANRNIFFIGAGIITFFQSVTNSLPDGYFLVSFTRAKGCSLPPSSPSMRHSQASLSLL